MAVVAVDLRSLVLGVAGRTGNAFAVMVAGMRIGLTVLQVLGFFCDSCIALMSGQAGFVVGRDELIAGNCVFFGMAGGAVFNVLVIGLYLLSGCRKGDK